MTKTHKTYKPTTKRKCSKTRRESKPNINSGACDIGRTRKRKRTSDMDLNYTIVNGTQREPESRPTKKRKLFADIDLSIHKFDSYLVEDDISCIDLIDHMLNYISKSD